MGHTYLGLKSWLCQPFLAVTKGEPWDLSEPWLSHLCDMCKNNTYFIQLRGHNSSHHSTIIY